GMLLRVARAADTQVEALADERHQLGRVGEPAGRRDEARLVLGRTPAQREHVLDAVAREPRERLGELVLRGPDAGHVRHRHETALALDLRHALGGLAPRPGAPPAPLSPPAGPPPPPPTDRRPEWSRFSSAIVS